MSEIRVLKTQHRLEKKVETLKWAILMLSTYKNNEEVCKMVRAELRKLK